jgi:polyisoprenoid-binding protein YceI
VSRGLGAVIRSAAMTYMTKVLLATALLSVGCKSELDGKPVAKVGEAKGDAKPATDAKPDVKTDAPAVATKTLKADPATSKIEFVGAKITGDHKGEFKTFTGQATVAGTVPQSVQFSIETGSVVSDAEDLTGHLKSPDFFDVAQFPKAGFGSTKIEAKAAGDANYEVTGDLDLHGVKKSITFPAKITVDERGAKGTAEFKINRKDFGIVYAGKADDLIKDEVLLKISLGFTG